MLFDCPVCKRQFNRLADIIVENIQSFKSLGL